MVRSTLTPSSAAIVRSCSHERCCRPNAVWVIIQVKATISTTVVTMISSWLQPICTVKSGVCHSSMPPSITGGIGLTRAPWVSCTVFCRKIDMPIAEISGASRVEPRSGR